MVPSMVILLPATARSLAPRAAAIVAYGFADVPLAPLVVTPGLQTLRVESLAAVLAT